MKVQKMFCESLREHGMKTANFKKKKIKSLTKEEKELYENAKICYIFYLKINI